jgi:aminoglycoside phosphotransferase (APT) family kinase protein
MMPIPQELIRRVPGCESGDQPLSVRPLAGGRGANSVWRVATSVGDFVMRFRHPPIDRPGSFSRFELASHRLAAAAGLAPRLVDAAPDGGWLLMEFVAAPAWSEAQLLSEAGIDALGEVLQRVHALACGTLPRMDAAGIARDQVGVILQRPDRAGSASVALAAIERNSRELSRLSDRAVLNHGDLMAANLLGPGTGMGPMLVDWEYAQRADPTWDVACLLEYYPGLGRQLERLLHACGLSTAEDRHILSLQRHVFTGLNRLWQQAESGNWIS